MPSGATPRMPHPTPHSSNAGSCSAAVAEVALNSAPVGRAANAHRPHGWDVTRLLAVGSNLLEVTLLSAPAYALAEQAVYPYSVPATQVMCVCV